jgi:tetratricopeptide (TPR) repeat protein
MSAPNVRLLFSLATVCVLCPAPALQAQGQKEMPITTSSKEALVLFYQGRDLYENYEWVPARAVLGQAVTKDPSFAMAHRLLAAMSGDENARREYLDKALAQMDKVSPGEKLYLASHKAYMDGNNIEQVRCFDELVKLFPGDKHVLWSAAMIAKDRKHDYPGAYAYYRQALALDPAFAAAWGDLGYICMHMGKYEEADQVFQNYIKARPGKPNPYDDYGDFLLDRGRYDDAITQYQQALDADPMYSDGYRGIGDSYVFKSDCAKARVAYQQMSDHATNPAVRLEGQFWIAVSYLHEGRLADALANLGRYRVLAHELKQSRREFQAARDTSFIQVASGDLAGATRTLESAQKDLTDSTLSDQQKAWWRAYLKIMRANVLTSVHAFDAAGALLAEVAGTPEVARDQSLARELEAGQGLLALERMQPDESLTHFAKGNQDWPYLWLKQAQAWTQKGDLAKAAEWKGKIAACNENGMAIAMIRGKIIQ